MSRRPGREPLGVTGLVLAVPGMETFLRAWRSRDSFDGSSLSSAWLYASQRTFASTCNVGARVI